MIYKLLQIKAVHYVCHVVYKEEAFLELHVEIPFQFEESIIQNKTYSLKREMNTFNISVIDITEKVGQTICAIQLVAYMVGARGNLKGISFFTRSIFNITDCFELTNFFRPKEMKTAFCLQTQSARLTAALSG